MTPIRRVFIDWSRPPLPTAAAWLLAGAEKAKLADLRETVVALPGSRAGRRLIESLVELAEERGQTLFPPQVVTVGALPELLYDAKRPFANALTQRLAWAQALREMPRERLNVIARDLPRDDDLPPWLSLAELLGKVHRELAASALDFRAVAREGARLPAFDERERWEVLAEIRERYLAILDGLGLWDLQTARLFAIEHREGRTHQNIVLVGTVDLDVAQRKMLDMVSDRVTSLIFAPSELAPRFDAHGCLIPESWRLAHVPLGRERIEIVDGPADQVEAAVTEVARWNGRFSAEEIVVGIPDERIAPSLIRRLGEFGLPARQGVGRLVSRTGPFRMLEALVDILETPRFEAFAALLRLPTIEEWLAGRNLDFDFAAAADDWFEQALPADLPPDERESRWGKAIQARQAFLALEEALAGLRDARRKLDAWGPVIFDLLLKFHSARPLNDDDPRDRQTVLALEALLEGLRELADVPADLAPETGFPEAATLALAACATQTIPPASDRPEIELLGWLELALDDAPALIVTGFNDGIVPESQNGDLFLPNALRRALELEDNDRRHARDLYALSTLAASRQELKVIAARRDIENYPLAPSRLLFAQDDDELAERARLFFSRPKDSRPGRPTPAPSRVSALTIPRPKPLERPIDTLRVTQFRDYLACPYRFYLKHVAKLARAADDDRELTPRAFGSLLHDALQRFGESDEVDSHDADRIARRLSDELDRLAEKRFGSVAAPAVYLQIEQARIRLREFALRQADWRRQGWKIVRVEREQDDTVTSFSVDGKPILVKGRIDRVDRHETTGEWAVFDYKSGDVAKSPEQAHRDRNDWIDLQLPLYRRLAREMGFEGKLSLGYILLPRDGDEGGMRLAAWTEDDLKDADHVAMDVVRGVRREEFWPPASDFKGEDDFAVILERDRFELASDDELAEEDA